MRGKAAVCAIVLTALRITPAYAGKSFRAVVGDVGLRDHPRLCGEKIPYEMSAYQKKGSPPPMRGKAVVTGKAALCCGITPAYAGKSFFCRLTTF